ncbi:unnamed protein product [Rotaria socialis]|uniref:Cyclic nucleotide-binding domain-containing protein n=1 Tax=Rotaria socialis TaxID=392032 RepID=A0A820W388_9BILA|nr:unnamed protein product [Rotaria socialis]
MAIENNSTNQNLHEESKSSTVILFLSSSILVGCIVKIIFSRILKNTIPLPFTISVLIVSFVIGIMVTEITNDNNDFFFGEIQLSHINPHLIYYIFLPLLIFDSSFNGHFHVIKQQLLSAILMAGPGVFISTVIIAICGIYIFPYNWSWLLGLLFGSILSATDPVAVVALLHDSGASRSLASLIDSESLLNDGSAFVIFLIFYNIVIGGDHSAKKIIVDIVKYSIVKQKIRNSVLAMKYFEYIFLGGPAFGLACGIISVIILNRINNELEVEITFTFGLAYLIFYVADVELGVSAVLALVTMGLYMSKYKYCISNNVQSSMASAWRIATFFINILIFTVTGIILASSFIGTSTTITAKDFGFSIVLYIIIHIGRIITVVILHPFMKWTGVYLSWKDCVILIWSGLRGSMALILVLIISLDTSIDSVIRDRFLFHVSMIVLLTLVINGTSSKFLVKLLGLHHGTKESETVLLQALEHVRRQTSWKLSTLKRDEKFADVDWKVLNQYLPDKLLEELDQENSTTFHQQLSTMINENSPTSTRRSSRQSTSTDFELQTIPTIYQTNSMPNSPIVRNKFAKDNDMILPIINILDDDSIHDQNIRNALITRFLTAISIDYEKQWYLGMIRRSTLNILIKSVEQAKQKNSFKLHWQLIVQHFRLTMLLRCLIKFHYFNFINQWTYQLFFDHIFRTIELTLSFHSAKTRLDNIRVEFPELSNIHGRLMREVCDEVKMYQLNAMHVLLDLQQSYRLCWTIQMTRRCAQMLLKYESVAIIQLYETGMLEEKEYSHILELIENKLFSLEYGNIQMSENQKKRLENPFDLIPYFQLFSSIEKKQWESLMTVKHKWFQPGTILIQQQQRVTTAYLIVRGIVRCKDDAVSTYYKCGSIVGIDALFSENSSSYGTYAVDGGLVETYSIDRVLLNLLLSDEKIARSIYDEIALHVIMNNYKKSFKLTHSQLRMLLNGKVVFYKNQSDLTIELQVNQRLLLLSGTMIRYANDEEEIIIDSFHFILIDSPATYKLNSSSVVYIWTLEDEDLCLNITKFKINFPNENNRVDHLEPFYPLYLGVSTEFSPRRHSSSITRPIEHSNQLQFIPSEIGIQNEENIPIEYSL